MNFLLIITSVITSFISYTYYKYQDVMRYKFIKDIQENKYELNQTLKNRFSKNKIPDNIDVIIIGSGMSSLTLGCILSRVGKKVLILEKHYIAGGSMHTFCEKGVEFDVGLHYIGSIKEFKEVINLLGDKDVNLEWNQIGKNNYNIYDKISINNHETEGYQSIHFSNNKKHLINQICTYYPNKRNDIETYFDTIEYANKCGKYLVLFKILPIWLSKLIDNLVVYFKYPRDIHKCLYFARNNTYDVIKNIIPNAEDSLINLLTCQYGDIGVKADKSSFIYHAGLTSHYINGGFYPVGGSNILVHKMISCIKNFGGEVLVNAPVRDISFMTKNEKLYSNGVYVKNQLIESKIVVSSIGTLNTVNNLLNLIDNNNNFVKLKNELAYFKPSTSHINVFLTLKGNPEELNLPQHNHWIINNNFKDEEIDPIMFISFPSARNPDWLKIEKHEGKSNCIIIVEANYEEFQIYNHQKSGNRENQYKILKENITNRILNQFYQYYPKLKDKILSHITGTPVTNEYYLNSINGCSYGLEHSPLRASDYITLRPETPFNNLFFTGQDITSAGIAGAMFSGIVTSHSILGYGLKEMILNKNIIKDLQKIY